MKVLDYEQVNGDQDKDEEAMEAEQRRRRDRAKRPDFDNQQTASYMHGSHIAQSTLGHPTVIPEHRNSSSETAVEPGQNLVSGGNMRAVGNEGRGLNTAEKMV
jgi:hypothetical protein